MSLFFSTIEVTKQAFYRSSLSYAIVNLKPIVPGHVLVVPTRPVPRIADLDGAVPESELTSLMRAVQRVGSVVERAYGASALTVACQDGAAAGQSVPHVHFHILPRKLSGDKFAGKENDAIYPALEHAENHLKEDLVNVRLESKPEPIRMDADAARPPRTMQEMIDEANWLKGFFTEGEE
ncbi:HIT domain-containing protein [Mycena chlorophos]|uniref:HIT domain-containing protein n=1 Tax=Mycena chlorophos TaxID=658473 RepID=A0A8H6STW4_MYCCL|nr:HIT domain-containing protein [Mycena chlorophos]